MTVTVSFEAPQVRVENGSMGIEIAQVIMPYSIHNTEDQYQYLGGQTILTKEDGVKFTDNTAGWNKLALAKIKDMVSSAEIPVYYAVPERPNIVPGIDSVTLEEGGVM